MLTNISWSEYSIFILVVVFSYYLILVFVFYKRDIINLIENINRPGTRSNIFNSSLPAGQEDVNLITKESNLPDIFKHLQQEIKSNLESAKRRAFLKEEIVQSLQLVLKGNKAANTSPYIGAINDYIQIMCEDICSIHLNDEEVQQLWFR